MKKQLVLVHHNHILKRQELEQHRIRKKRVLELESCKVLELVLHSCCRVRLVLLSNRIRRRHREMTCDL